MRYAGMFLGRKYDIRTFSCVFAHHLRQHPMRRNSRAMDKEEYSKNIGAPKAYIRALWLAKDNPTTLILDDMNLIISLDGKVRNKDEQETDDTESR